MQCAQGSVDFQIRDVVMGGWVPQVRGLEAFLQVKNRQFAKLSGHLRSSEVTLRQVCGGCSPINSRNDRVQARNYHLTRVCT